MSPSIISHRLPALRGLVFQWVPIISSIPGRERNSANKDDRVCNGAQSTGKGGGALRPGILLNKKSSEGRNKGVLQSGQVESTGIVQAKNLWHFEQMGKTKNLSSNSSLDITVCRVVGIEVSIGRTRRERKRVLRTKSIRLQARKGTLN